MCLEELKLFGRMLKHLVDNVGKIIFSLLMGIYFSLSDVVYDVGTSSYMCVREFIFPLLSIVLCEARIFFNPLLHASDFL